MRTGSRTKLHLALLTCLPSLLAASAIEAQVTFERLRETAKEPGNWLHYSGNYQSHRYSPLAEIDRTNVADLKVAWVYQVEDSGLVETTPLVVDGIMYLTEPLGAVVALDAATGKRLWRWSRSLSDDLLHIGFPRVNRGVAILDDTLYVGMLDAQIYALDRRSGAERWHAKVADNETGHALTAAPLALRDKVVVGTAGGEAGIRGFVDAYDAKTGERVWRFWTIPGPGEPGHDTWGGESWRSGAGATWTTGSYDPELDLLYWAVGNPGPDWNGDVRPGDNLFTCSVVALEPATGKLRWYFQFTPHDVHDWDSNQMLVLVDREWEGEPRKLLVMANRNGFYYVLDRETGKFLNARAYVKQTWAERIDETGRPVVLPDTEPTEEGNLVYPSLQGATNWYAPSYDPRLGLFFVPAREMGAYYYKSDVDYEPGKPYMGGGQRALDGEEAYGAVRALDVLTGERRWEFKLRTPLRSGVMATAGGLVFGSSNEGNAFALDSETGEPLWSFQTGARIVMNPMSFAVAGRQHVAIASGGAVFIFALP